jgi:hypothetical protein
MALAEADGVVDAEAVSAPLPDAEHPLVSYLNDLENLSPQQLRQRLNDVSVALNLAYAIAHFGPLVQTRLAEQLRLAEDSK